VLAKVWHNKLVADTNKTVTTTVVVINLEAVVESSRLTTMLGAILLLQRSDRLSRGHCDHFAIRQKKKGLFRVPW